MARSVAWSDGTKWIADEATFRRVTERLDAVREYIMGLDPIFARWVDQSAASDRLDVDAITPSEEDRAIMTAALARALEDAREATAAELGFDDPLEYTAFLARLAALHQLFMTDVTYDRYQTPRP